MKNFQKHKRCLLIAVVLIGFINLFACSPYYGGTLEEYIELIERNNYRIGFSDYELDRPSDFLPSVTFLKDFNYTKGEYFCFETGLFAIESKKITLLCLTYEPSIYLEAKLFMIENIPQRGSDYYYYDDYVFYENDNFYIEDQFPMWFTMACYNDTKNELVFLGFSSGYSKSMKVGDSIDDWKAFIDTNYGEFYDFSA